MVGILLDWIALALVAVNCALVVYNWRALRRIAVLNGLLGRICIDAFMSQHQPIWQAWGQVMQCDLDVTVTPIQRRREP